MGAVLAGSTANCATAQATVTTATRGARLASDVQEQPTTSEYFNAGVLVLTPSRRVAAAMAASLRRSDLSRFPFAEQDFLNVFFTSRRWRRLPWEYNATKALFGCHRETVWDYSRARVIHYTMAKPWELGHPCHRGFAKLNMLWLAAYSEPAAIGRVLLRLHLEDKRRRAAPMAAAHAGTKYCGMRDDDGSAKSADDTASHKSQ